MKTRIYNFDQITTVLSDVELQNINGGGFAYDIAFFIRETINYAINGQGVAGTAAVCVDISLNYRPVN